MCETGDSYDEQTSQHCSFSLCRDHFSGCWRSTSKSLMISNYKTAASTVPYREIRPYGRHGMESVIVFANPLNSDSLYEDRLYWNKFKIGARSVKHKATSKLAIAFHEIVRIFGRLGRIGSPKQHCFSLQSFLFIFFGMRLGGRFFRSTAAQDSLVLGPRGSARKTWRLQGGLQEAKSQGHLTSIWPRGFAQGQGQGQFDRHSNAESSTPFPEGAADWSCKVLEARNDHPTKTPKK